MTRGRFRWWAGKLVRAAFGLLILLGAVVGVFSLFAQGHRYPLVPPSGPTALRGAFHVHSTASDGRGDREEIARAARKAGLSFVILTDHNLEELPPPQYLSGVLLISAVEESTPWGHVVALGTPRGLTEEERRTDPIATIARLGGTAILAHPVQERNPWRDWEAGVRADGLELYSADTFFRRTLRRPGRLACAVGAYLAQPLHGLMVMVEPEPSETEQRLFSLVRDAERRGAPAPTLALCSHDAHGLPRYEQVFRALATYLPADVGALSSDPAAAADQVTSAIRSGRSYCAFHGLADASGFRIDGLRAQPVVGDRLVLQLPQVPAGGARVVVSGGASLDADGRTVRLERPGPARIEVQLLAPGCTTARVWRPWIVLNPLNVADR